MNPTHRDLNMSAIGISQLLFVGFIGYPELIVLAVIVLVIFGSSRLPSLMRSLGRSANEFKAGLKDPVDQTQDDIAEESDKK